MPDDAVMDAAVDTAAEPEVSAEPVETGAEPVEQGTDAQPEPGQQIEAAPAPLIDGQKLSAEAKATLDKIKLENPALARAMQRALFKEAEYAKELPGGIKELRGLRETVETLGGTHGIEELQQEIGGFRQWDEQYAAGDPKAIDFMLQNPQGQESFVKLMPHALQKFEELHPDGYTNYMAQVFGHYMAQSGIPLALERMGDFIGDNPRAQEQWGKLAGFVKGISDLAQRKVEPPKLQQAQPDNERATFEQEKQTFERNKWKEETAGPQRAIFEREWNALAAGRKISDGQSETIKELFEIGLNKAINGAHADKLNRYFQAKDKQGFMRYADTLNQSEIPKALRAAFDKILPVRPGPKLAQSAPAKNGATPPAKGMAIAQGFTQVAQRPQTHEIDYTHPFNNTKNYQEGRAVLKGGKKVQWSKA